MDEEKGSYYTDCKAGQEGNEFVIRCKKKIKNAVKIKSENKGDSKN